MSHLAVATACRSAFDAKRGALARLANACNDLRKGQRQTKGSWVHQGCQADAMPFHVSWKGRVYRGHVTATRTETTGPEDVGS